jgi:hypothetical protein
LQKRFSFVIQQMLADFDFLKTLDSIVLLYSGDLDNVIHDEEWNENIISMYIICLIFLMVGLSFYDYMFILR